jgi:hypothetical protein
MIGDFLSFHGTAIGRRRVTSGRTISVGQLAGMDPHDDIVLAGVG